jgi:hypothetical protein
MRDGLDAPTLDVPAENRKNVRAFLDGQHEQRGVEGPLYDHHLVLGLDDEDCATGDMRALDTGMRCPRPYLTEPTSIDIHPVSEGEALTNLCVACEWSRMPHPGPLEAVLDAAYEAGIAHSGGSLVRLIDLPSGGSVLYDAEANT